LRAILRAVATANPRRYVTQKEAYEAYCSHFDLRPAERKLYERILLDGPIEGRYVAVDDNRDARETNPDRLNERFRVHGTLIAGQAARDAMAAASLEPGDIGGLVVNTCTGYLCPGLSSYVAEELGLGPSIRVLDVMGMGCGAAIPNLECAAGMVARGAQGPILSIAVEICTATLFMGPSADLIVSNCLFGDGAAAAIVDGGAAEGAKGLLRLVDFESGLFPAYREDLRYRTEQGRLRNTLSKNVPGIGAETVAHVARRLLGRHGLPTSAIDWWVVHPGGTVVLDRVAEELGLPQSELRFSYSVLRHYGNMSSPSVLFVLKKILDEGKPQPGQKGLLLSFGAGFTAFAALVEF